MNLPPGQPPIDPRGTLRPPGPPTRPQMPPPGMPPPPGFGYPPPSPRNGGKGWLIGLLVGLVLLVGLGLLVMVMILGAVAGGSGRTATTVVRSAGATDQTVAVIPVNGMILDDVEQQFQEDLDRVRDDANVKAVVIRIDSPGGTVTDSHQMYAALLDFRDETGKPVVVHMDQLAASGGYLLACGADEIFAEETTITGSIGVLMQYPQLSEFAEKTGIRFQTVVSDASPHKNTPDMWQEPTEAELAELKVLLNQQYDLFRTIVETGRGSAIAKAGSTLDAVANGRIFLGPEARTLGLVDQIGFLDDAVASAAKRAGLSNPRTVLYQREPTLAELMGLAATPVRPSAQVLRLSREELEQSVTRVLHELSSPRTMYLYRGAQ